MGEGLQASRPERWDGTETAAVSSGWKRQEQDREDWDGGTSSSSGKEPADKRANGEVEWGMVMLNSIAGGGWSHVEESQKSSRWGQLHRRRSGDDDG
ncbi:hypothetical protein Dda_1298 [Drechslerella dactyloides]|uniref:Uncharacterized protein n=1 Tax=Drechslerella dactyloides TaxID=74499 RepID=A0AAD6J5Y8_DREDA|nr:hypothetical protein Dda_1298 [Drechslerella dactyloides]